MLREITSDYRGLNTVIIIHICSSFFFFFPDVRIEPRALHLLGKSSTDLNPQPHNFRFLNSF